MNKSLIVALAPFLFALTAQADEMYCVGLYHGSDFSDAYHIVCSKEFHESGFFSLPGDVIGDTGWNEDTIRSETIQEARDYGIEHLATLGSERPYDVLGRGLNAAKKSAEYCVIANGALQECTSGTSLTSTVVVGSTERVSSAAFLTQNGFKPVARFEPRWGMSIELYARQK